MKKLAIVFTVGIIVLLAVSMIVAQEISRKVVGVPKVDPLAVTIDGKMDEAVWQSAAQANMITSTGFEIWANKYYREALVEPDFDELSARLMWAKDTLFLFVHIDEFVNDSTSLFWPGKWSGDQLFIGLSNRLSTPMMGWYDGNIYAAPDGPYHFLVLGDQVTLNNNELSYIPEQYRGTYADSQAVFNASDICRSATFIDKATGVWDVELAIYNPNVTAQSSIGFNLGGSCGSDSAFAWFGDAYAYWCWQPNEPDNPYGIPAPNDPGYYNLVNTDYWAMLNFLPGADDIIIRKEIDVPTVDPLAVTIDGKMDETVWQKAAQANMITSTGFEIWANKYYREALVEPDFDELSARLMWAKDTLFLFVHIDEFVNDSTSLFWPGKWAGDQLFIGLSNRLSTPMMGWYDGNIYAAPDGPYHFLVLGDQVTLNNNELSYIPEQYRGTYADSQAVFNASDICRSATFIDKAAGVWDVELAIYNPNVTAQSSIGFNLGGSCGSDSAFAWFGDAYAYWCWQPNEPDNPYAIPAPNDPGYYNLVNTDYWAMLNFKTTTTGVFDRDLNDNRPARFSLSQNYPNPFNPSTTIRFDVAKQGPISLKVYNVLGHEVAVLIDQKIMSIGTYSVTWNAEALSSGVYFYKLEAPGVVETQKMMLLR